jgi:hypothetical protein
MFIMFVTCWPFQPSLMLVDKYRILHLTIEGSTFEMLHPRIGSGLVHKQTRLDRLLRDKHLSSLPTFTNYGPEGV